MADGRKAVVPSSSSSRRGPLVGTTAQAIDNMIPIAAISLGLLATAVWSIRDAFTRTDS
jgi:hypothetical protein